MAHELAKPPVAMQLLGELLGGDEFLAIEVSTSFREDLVLDVHAGRAGAGDGRIAIRS